MTRLSLVAATAALGLAAPALADSALLSFQTPTKNIGCIMDSTYGARCDIAKRDWSPPARPKSCPSVTGYGQGLEVGRKGRGHIVCAGDTTLRQGGVLAYGHSRRLGRYKCTSRAAGVTCTNLSTDHGFFISRQSYRRF
jgi:hypothetical protein